MNCGSSASSHKLATPEEVLRFALCRPSVVHHAGSQFTQPWTTLNLIRHLFRAVFGRYFRGSTVQGGLPASSLTWTVLRCGDVRGWRVQAPPRVRRRRRCRRYWYVHRRAQCGRVAKDGKHHPSVALVSREYQSFAASIYSRIDPPSAPMSDCADTSNSASTPPDRVPKRAYPLWVDEPLV